MKTLFFLLLCVLPVQAQNGKPPDSTSQHGFLKKAPDSTAPNDDVTPAAKPTIAVDDLLEVTKVISQYRKLIILKKENEEAINNALNEAAAKIAAWEQKHRPTDVDPKTHYFNWDELKWLPRPKKEPDK